MTSDKIIYIIIVLVVVFVSMVLHELMHGLTAYWLGDNTAKEHGRLTLNPIKHIDPFMTILLPVIMILMGGPVFGGAKPVPFRPDKVKGGEWGAALVGIAGPLTNLILAFLCYGAIVVFNIYSGLVGEILYAGVMVNLGFFAFNILPIPPLDGSRVLYAIAPEGFQRVMSAIESAGLLVVFAIVLLLSQPLGMVLNAIINFVLKIFGMAFGLV
ncbi:MAG: site-2 protease family protein [Candidatus Nomurabacteria bacterium]|jgi:Zn-dependent protease|nr:site-2 protease family protein [Candidatus Nomurabacteria bacterium]